MIPVLHLRSSQGLYGADQALLALACATPGPYFPMVGSLARPGRPDLLSEEAARRNLPTLRLVSSHKADFSSVLALTAFCRKQRIRLVHAHDYKALAIAVAARPFSRVPVVATYHGDTGSTPTLRAYETFARLCGNCSAGVAAVSRPLWRQLCRWIVAAPVACIPNGLAPVTPISEAERAQARMDFGIEPDRFAVATLGRLSVEKGHRILVDALATMARPPFTLLAGDGPLLSELQNASAKLPVRFLGFLPNPRALYAACDLVVLPSLTEGLPMVALEAMAHRRPLLATSVGELPTLLSNGAGKLVHAGDFHALAAAMEELHRSPEIRNQLAKAARVRVEGQYSAQAMAASYVETLYAPALAERLPEPGVSQER